MHKQRDPFVLRLQRTHYLKIVFVFQSKRVVIQPRMFIVVFSCCGHAANSVCHVCYSLMICEAIVSNCSNVHAPGSLTVSLGYRAALSVPPPPAIRRTMAEPPRPPLSLSHISTS